MCRVLILNENRLERENMVKILEEGLPKADILTAAAPQQALDLLAGGPFSLVIVDVPWFDADYCNMIAAAKELAPEAPILATSTGKRSEIVANVWRLGVQDYLLKPYRPAWLTAAAEVMIRWNAKPAGEWEKDHRERYLKQAAEHMQAFCYKKCINTTKDYLDSLYEETDDIDVIRFSVLSFAEGLARLGGSLGPPAQLKLSNIIERFRLRFDQQGRKHDSFLVLEKMWGVIFDAIDEDRCYAVSDEQRVLNYVDRNVKEGIGLDEAAEYANMSSSYFSKFFKRITGVNFITYMMDGKISAAKDMLTDTDMPVINIAYELSYSETNYFGKAFKKKVGLTPTEYREQHQHARGAAGESSASR